MLDRVNTIIHRTRRGRPSAEGRFHVVFVAVLGALALLAVVAAPVLAAAPQGSPSEHRHGKGEEVGGGEGGGGGTGEEAPATAGFDVSYPQCGTALPEETAFGIVGVNDGLANTLNPCFGVSALYSSYEESELYWALTKAIGGTPQPRASLYVNTADPGNVYNSKRIEDWPTGGADPAGEACTTEAVRLRGKVYTVGQDSPACAWQYGFQRASDDVASLQEAAEEIEGKETATPVSGEASGYPWWLDVESANSWQSGSEGQAMNRADLEGMVAAFAQAGAPSVGIYSTGSQWSQITGGTPPGSGLYGLPDWVPGASSLSGAKESCESPSFTGGGVALAQWLLNGSIDADYVCR